MKIFSHSTTSEWHKPLLLAGALRLQLRCVHCSDPAPRVPRRVLRGDVFFLCIGPCLVQQKAPKSSNNRCKQSRQMSGFKINAALKKITTSSHPESFRSASHGHIAKPLALISKIKTNWTGKKQSSWQTGSAQVTPNTAKPLHGSSSPQPGCFPLIPSHTKDAAERTGAHPFPQLQVSGQGAAAPCSMASHCAEEHQGWTWRGASVAGMCSSRKLTRDLVARSQVYPQGCKSKMPGPAQSQNTCLWDIQTAWNRGHRGPIRNSILAL